MVFEMPYTAKDAYKHNHSAKSGKAKRAFAETFNSALKRYGNETTAFKVANSAVRKTNSANRRKRKPSSKKSVGVADMLEHMSRGKHSE